MSRRKRKLGKPRVRLAYRVTSGPRYQEVFLAAVQSAERIHRLHRALKDSRTWGELRAAVSHRDYEWIVTDRVDAGHSRRRPAPSDPFRAADQINSYMEGDYPPWAKQLVGRYLPQDLLDKYAKSEFNMINGSWWTIPAGNWPDLKRELEGRGYKLVERSDLTEFR